jgi:NAD+ kinase
MSTRSHIFFYHRELPELKNQFISLINQTNLHHFNVVDDSKDANIIISIGNDGDFLQAVRSTGFRQDCLYIGISGGEKISLYNDFLFEDANRLLDALSLEQLEVRSYPVLEVSIDRSTSYYCLNEFSIQSAIVKTFVMDIFIDDLHLETFRGDGVIVSTPTGSTGYNKSAHGAILDPMIPCIQVIELASINNNQYRTLGNPFILSANRVLTLKIAKEGNEFPIMAMDNEALSIRHVENIEIKLSNKKIKTLKTEDNSFWHKVKRTFL